MEAKKSGVGSLRRFRCGIQIDSCVAELKICEWNWIPVGKSEPLRLLYNAISQSSPYLVGSKT